MFVSRYLPADQNPLRKVYIVNLDGIINKAKDALGSEERSDQLLDAAANVANKLTGAKYADKIQQARDAADARIGEENTSPTPNEPAGTSDPQ